MPYYNWGARREVSDMVGKTFTSVPNVGKYNDEIVFSMADGSRYVMCHQQDCCEQVAVEEIVGDLSDLVGSPILRAEESSNHEENPEYCYESATWTFYKFATIKGEVVIRWLGTSNGYYSEGVDLFLLEPDDGQS